MSYKVALTDLERGGAMSVTQQLVARFVAAIDSGELAPGEQLPTTRGLAVLAQINHLTAARAYRQLAEAGYVTARVGAGTFVRTVPPAAPAADDAREDDFLASVLPVHAPSFGAQALLESFRLPDEPGIISLATGWADPALAPVDELGALAAEVFAAAVPSALGYCPPEGVPELRRELGARGRTEGWASGPEEIAVTSGATQALDLVLRAVLSPGDAVAVESPSFIGTLDSLRDMGARLLPVPVDAGGLSVDALERHLARHEVRLVVLQPACQNPTGRDLDPERRRRLLALARERSFLIVEDWVYGNLRLDGAAPAHLSTDAPTHVILVDSVSKTVAGGLRIGWIAARPPILQRVVARKLRTDIHTPGLTQHVVARWLASGRHEAHLARTLPVYRERRDALLDALRRELGSEVRVTTPTGGHHVWATLRRPVDERSFYTEALHEGVAFLPGSSALADPTVASAFRLSFSLVAPDELREGVRRLARALTRTRSRELGAAAVLPS